MTGTDFKVAVNFAAPETVIDTAGGGTVDIGSVDSNRILMTGGGTVTSFGNVPGQFRIVRYASALALHHNGTSLFLGPQADRITIANAIGGYVSDHVGNWREIFYLDPPSASPLPSGTSMLFMQAAAPTGWTKSTAHDDKALRIVSGGTGGGSGGSSGFSSVFGASKSTAGFSFPAGVLPALSATYDAAGSVHGAFLDTAPNGVTGIEAVTAGTLTVDYVPGTGGPHSHTLSLDIEYVDAIICTKN